MGNQQTVTVGFSELLTSRTTAGQKGWWRYFTNTISPILYESLHFFRSIRFAVVNAVDCGGVNNSAPLFLFGETFKVIGNSGINGIRFDDDGFFRGNVKDSNRDSFNVGDRLSRGGEIFAACDVDGSSFDGDGFNCGDGSSGGSEDRGGTDVDWDGVLAVCDVDGDEFSGVDGSSGGSEDRGDSNDDGVDRDDEIFCGDTEFRDNSVIDVDDKERSSIMLEKNGVDGVEIFDSDREARGDCWFCSVL